MAAAHPDSSDRADQRFRAVVIGVSAGGIRALFKLFASLPAEFRVPIIVVQHLLATESDRTCQLFAGHCSLPVHEAEEKEPALPGHIYFAPANYHLLIEQDESFALSVDKKVCYARPSIDVLFDSAAHVWAGHLLAVVLTGANDDGAQGMRTVKQLGGTTIAQEPASAEFPTMPQAAIDTGCVDHVLPLEGIGPLLARLANGSADESAEPKEKQSNETEEKRSS